MKNLKKQIKNSRRKKKCFFFFFPPPPPPHVSNIPANMKLRFRNRIQEVVGEFAYPPASSTFQHCPFALSSSSPSPSSAFNSLPSQGAASPPAMPEDTCQN